MAERRPISFADLPGWGEVEARALLDGVRRHLAPEIRSRPHEAPWLEPLAPLFDPVLLGDDPLVAAERLFVPWRIEADGFLTGYYEPVIAASRTPGGTNLTPLYRRPDDLVRTEPRPDLPGDGTFARRLPDGTLVPYFDRVAIESGALAGRGLELAWVTDPVDAFFAQIQGSARLRFPDGSEARIGYHGKSGHPYTAIGRVLIDRGVLPEGGATMQTIRAALAADPAIVRSVLQANRSFVFFRERIIPDPALGPIGAGGVPLIPWRSLAVDRSEIALGTGVYVETTVPRHGAFAGVLVAEDTGSAIIGPARGDIYFGSGPDAGEIAGEMKAPARLTVFLPKAGL